MKSATTKMKANHWQFRLPRRCSGTTRGESPNEACPELHLEPLDTVIGQVPAPYCPDGRHGQQVR